MMITIETSTNKDLIFSCEKDCNQIVSSACNDEVPNELCQAVFNRWFFNK